MQREASKTSSGRKSTSAGSAVFHDLSEPPPTLTSKDDSRWKEQGHPMVQRGGEANGHALIISCFVHLSHTTCRDKSARRPTCSQSTKVKSRETELVKTKSFGEEKTKAGKSGWKEAVL